MEQQNLTLSDIRMYQKAAEQRWPIEPKHRQEILMRLLRIVAHPESKDRAVIAASRTIAALDVINLNDDKKRRAESDRNRFLEVAERLGIAHAAAPVPPGDSGTSDIIIDGTAVERTGEGHGEEAEPAERVGPDSDPAGDELEST